MCPTTYTVSMFPPAFSYFWQFNPFLAFFNPTITFKANGLELLDIQNISINPKP